MPKILICQHVPYEILGTFNPLLKDANFRIKYVNFGRHPDTQPSILGYDGLVILGGPYSANDDDKYPHIQTELALIHDAIDKDMPVLGICLGSQLIARALGAENSLNTNPEIGWYDVTPTQAGLEDPLIHHFSQSQKIFQWHRDTFTLPKGAVHLAHSQTCENQAFRYKDNVYGFQFHLEVDKPLIERWLKIPAHRKELKSLEGIVSPQIISTETDRYIESSMLLSNQVFSSFIDLFGPTERTTILRTR